MVPHWFLTTVPERSSQEQSELKPLVKNGNFVTKLSAQFGFYLNLKNFVRNGPLANDNAQKESEFLENQI